MESVLIECVRHVGQRVKSPRAVVGAGDENVSVR